MSRVSVVIPGRNCAATIGECLLAVAAVRAHPGSAVHEVLFVDDGSTDGSAAAAAAGGAKVLQSPGRGAGAARNFGWRQAACDIVWFVDADCVADPGALAALLPHFEEPRVGAVGGAYDNRRPESFVACLIHEEIAARHRAMPRDVDFLASFNVAYRRSVLAEVGGFDERYLRGQDAELSFRTLARGHQLRFEARSRVAHFHEDRLSVYLRTQRQQGYWRAFLHLEHSGRVGGDSYSRLSDHLQPPVALLSPLFAGPLLGWAAAPWLAAVPLAALLTLQIPMCLRLWGHADRRVALAFAPFSAARAYWRGVGFTAGLVAKLTGGGRR